MGRDVGAVRGRGGRLSEKWLAVGMTCCGVGAVWVGEECLDRIWGRYGEDVWMACGGGRFGGAMLLFGWGSG